MAERFLIEARNRTLAVENGVIAEPMGRYDLVLRFPDADMRPGLINAHDHLHRNHYGRLGSPPYADAHAWADDVEARHSREIAAGRAVPRQQALLTGAWKNLFAGVTTVVHHDRWEPDFNDDFPLRVVRIPHAEPWGVAEIAPRRRFCVHLAEGTNAQAAGQIHDLQATARLGPDCLAVHCIGLDDDGIALFRRSGAALVWCPSSNLFLFGRTVHERLLAEGVDVLLGSDSLLSGDGDLLDELRCARSTGLLDDARLEAGVGDVATRRLGLAPARLEPGEPADLVVLSAPLLEASAADVQLVVAGGSVRIAAAGSQLGPLADGGVLARVGGVTRWIDRRPAKSGEAMNRSRACPDLPHEAVLQVNGE